jgi:hypothetical protein
VGDGRPTVAAAPGARRGDEEGSRRELGPARLAEALLIVGVLVAGAALRAVARSGLWIDEAISAQIASLPVGELLEALRHDGHPPLFYVLLRGWTSLAGTSDVALRSLSLLCSLAALPMAWFAGKRYAGRPGAVAFLVLLASSPFAIRYATEARMYALVMALVLAAWLAVQRALEHPSPARLLLVSVLAGTLLLTQYWSFYLWLATTVVLAVAALRSRSRRDAVLRTLTAVLAGVVLFLPWVPAMLVQLGRTGTPWGTAARPAPVIVSLIAGVPSGEAQLLGAGLVVLVALALFASGGTSRRIELDLATRPKARPELAVVGGTLLLGIVAGYVGGLASESRYLSVVVPLFLLVAAYGVTRLPSRAVRTGVLAVLAATGLLGGIANAGDERTQAPEIARAINDRLGPDDVVVYCPDQLGPAVSRLLPKGTPAVALPEVEGNRQPRRIDWSDYLDRVSATEPLAVAGTASDRAGAGAVWLVWFGGYRGFGDRCEEVVTNLSQLRARPEIVVPAAPEGTERAWLYRFAPRSS